MDSYKADKPDLIDLMQRIIQLSQQSLMIAEAEQWDKLQSLFQQRDKAIESLFSQAIPSEQAEAVRQCIFKVQALDKKTLKLSLAEKSATSHKIQNLKAGSQASKAYRQVRRLDWGN